MSSVLLALILCAAVCVSCEPSGNTVIIKQLPAGSTDTQLLDAFSNQSVSLVLLASDYVLGSQFDQYSGPYQEGWPTIKISRNITVSSVPGIDPPPMLDLQFRLAVLQLCDDCWFHFENISIKDERMGASAAYDFFLGEGNSVILERNVVRVRRACTDEDTATRLVSRTKRSSRFMGPKGSSQQMYAIKDLTWRGEVYPHNLLLLDYSVLLAKTFSGGYTVVIHNTWRLCMAYIDPNCLLDKDPDICVFQAIQSMSASQQQQQAARQRLSPGAIAAVVSATAVVAVLAATGAFCVYRKRRQLMAAKLAAGGGSSGSKDADEETGGASVARHSCDVRCYKDSSRRAAGPAGPFAARPAPSPKHPSGCGGGAAVAECSAAGGCAAAAAAAASTGVSPHGSPPVAGAAAACGSITGMSCLAALSVPSSGSYCSMPGPTLPAAAAAAVFPPAAATAACVGPQSYLGTASRSQSQPPAVGGSTASLNSTILCGNLSDLHFGPVLGTGSFGRVYKGRLGDVDVAVKVIEHDSSMSAAVANEVDLMLSCRHPNVVTAYHYVTHTHKQDITGTGSSSSNAKVLGALRDRPEGLPRGWELDRTDTAAAAAGGLAQSSNGGNDRPIPVLMGPKLHRQVCSACERDVWPVTNQMQSQELAWQQQQQQSDDGGASFSSVGASAVSAGSGSSDSSTTHSSSKAGPSQLGQSEGCTGTCSCSHHQQLERPSVERAWQYEGGFWPAGPSALLEDNLPQDDTLDSSDEGNMVTTWLIQEYCDAGTLRKQASTWLPSTEDDSQMLKRLLLLQDVVKGLRYLHSRSIVHGDLNARNVLVTSDPNSPCGLTAKLADLGLSRTIKQHNTHHTTCTVGTMSHCPPELLRHGHMSTSVDVYAFSIMAWEVFTGEIAFKELHYGQFFETVVLRNQRPRIPPSMPEDYRLLIEHCWVSEPSARPGTKALLECIALMISDRQHSTAQRNSHSRDSRLDQIFGRPRGSSEGWLSKGAMHELELQRMQHHQQQQQQQPQQQQSQRRRVQRQATPARFPAQQQHPQQPQPYAVHYSSVKLDTQQLQPPQQLRGLLAPGPTAVPCPLAPFKAPPSGGTSSTQQQQGPGASYDSHSSLLRTSSSSSGYSGSHGLSGSFLPPKPPEQAAVAAAAAAAAATAGPSGLLRNGFVACLPEDCEGASPRSVFIKDL